MKRIIAISFIVALFWQLLYQTGYILYWNINQDNIIKTECINRFKPMMHCNGKCVLYRQLKKAADEEAENNKFPVSVLKIKNLDTFIEIPTIVLPTPMVVSKQRNTFSEYTASPLNGFLITLLKPPQPLA